MACSGRQVLGSAEHHAHLAQVAVGLGLDQPRDAEVQEPRLLASRRAREEDVLRLEIPVDDALVVDGRQPLGQLVEQP